MAKFTLVAVYPCVEELSNIAWAYAELCFYSDPLMGRYRTRGAAEDPAIGARFPGAFSRRDQGFGTAVGHELWPSGQLLLQALPLKPLRLSGPPCIRLLKPSAQPVGALPSSVWLSQAHLPFGSSVFSEDSYRHVCYESSMQTEIKSSYYLHWWFFSSKICFALTGFLRLSWRNKHKPSYISINRC